MKKNLVVIILLLTATALYIWQHQSIPSTPVVSPAVDVSIPPEPEPESKPVVLAAVGDIMLARKTDRLMQSHGLGYPLAEMGSVLRAADVTFGNLESPLSTAGRQLPGKGIWFRARPEAVHVLEEGGFDIVNIANNHILDYDTPALLETMNILDKAGIRYVGAGRNIAEARQPAVIEAGEIKLGFLGYTEMADIFWSYDYPRMFQATDDTAGVAPLRTDDICYDVQQLRPEVDIVVVSLHWGAEYVRTPDRDQIEIARRLIDAGADIIIGHHPHVFQGLEIYNGRLIAYSLGNFIMDQNWSRETCNGLLLQLTLTKEGLQNVEVIPVLIVEQQPRRAEGKDADIILAELIELSRKLNTTVEIYGEKAVLEIQ